MVVRVISEAVPNLSNSLLEKLEGLQHKFEEISMLITDPAVIADMKRYIKLNKEYNELNKIMTAVKEYKTALTNISEAKEIYDKESDAELRELDLGPWDVRVLKEPRVSRIRDE